VHVHVTSDDAVEPSGTPGGGVVVGVGVGVVVVVVGVGVEVVVVVGVGVEPVAAVNDHEKAVEFWTLSTSPVPKAPTT
jgi:hypothetical protein